MDANVQYSEINYFLTAKNTDKKGMNTYHVNRESGRSFNIKIDEDIEVEYEFFFWKILITDVWTPDYTAQNQRVNLEWNL